MSLRYSTMVDNLVMDYSEDPGYTTTLSLLT